MSLLQINTAIPLGLAEPLLEQREEEERSVTVTTTRRESSESSGSSSSSDHSQYRTKFVVLGALTGFFIQVVSLGAYAFLLVHNNQSSKSSFMSAEVAALTESGIFNNNNSENSDNNNNDSEDDEGMLFGNTDTLTYTILSVLTQVDLIVYVLIWVAFTCTMTRNGMSCIRSQFFVAEEEDDFDDDAKNKKISSANSKKDNKIVKRRFVFVLGVYFLVGIVLGAFGAWSAIDMYLGSPIPFQPILATVAVDLVLCYMMVWCYDLGKKKKRRRSALSNKEQEQETIEFISSSSNYDSDDDSDDEDCETAMCC